MLFVMTTLGSRVFFVVVDVYHTSIPNWCLIGAVFHASDALISSFVCEMLH